MTRLNIGDPPDGIEPQSQRLESFAPWVWTACGIVLAGALAVLLLSTRPDRMPALDLYSTGPAHAATDTHHYPH